MSIRRQIIIVFSVLLFHASHCLGDSAYTPRLLDPLDESWRRSAFTMMKGQGLNCLDEGPGGSIWFGVDTGALQFNGLDWTRHGLDQGLPAPVISFATIDHQLYASTRSAIYAFGNSQWTEVFPRSSDRVWIFEDLTADSDGNLWSATCWGALRIAKPNAGPATAEQTLYAAPPVVSAWKNQQAERVQVVPVETPQRNPWGAGSGIYVYGPVPHGQVVVDLAEEGPGSRAGLRIGDQVVGINGEDRLTVYQNELDADAGSEIKLSIRRAGVAGLLELILTTVSEIPGDCETFRPYRIVEGADGTIWFATRLGNIISLETTANHELHWTHHTDDHDLPGLAVPSMTVTADGVAVVSRSTNSNALIQYDGTKWDTKELPRRISSSITSLRDGQLLIGSNGGILTVGEQGTTTRSTKDFGIFGNDVLVKQTSDNAIWIAGKGSIAIRVEPQHGVWTSYDGLIYQDTGQDGTTWFLSNRLSVVSRDGNVWRQYDIDDGLMSVPMVVVATKSGDVWAAGSHQGVAATSRRTDGKWTLKLHPQLSWCIDRRAAFEDRDGRMWFGAANIRNAESDMLGGVVRFDGQQWKHFVPTNRLTFVYGIGQTRDGSLWFGGPSLVQIRSNDEFGAVSNVPAKADGFCDAVASDRDGNLWVGTRNYGVMRMNGEVSAGDSPMWFDENQGLSDNHVRSILSQSDSTVLVSTSAGSQRYDGKSWTDSPFFSEIASKTDYSGMHQSPDGAIWSNTSTLATVNARKAKTLHIDFDQRSAFQTIRYKPNSLAPETRLDSAVSEISVGDDAVFTWTGMDAWNSTPVDRLCYSWRIDDGDWTPFTAQTRARVSDLPSGRHRLQVRTRDQDFNVDASPAVAIFQVIPPLWARTWFQTLMLFTGVLLGLAVVQTSRVYRRESKIRITNEKLILAERELQQMNAALEDRVIERTNTLNATNEQLRREIDERIAAELRASESEVRFRSIVQDQTEFIVRFNAEAEIEFVNAALLRASGRSLSSNNAAAVDSLPQQTRERVKKSIHNLSAEHPTNLQIIRVEGPDGRIGWEEWRGRVLLDDNQRLLGYQAVGRDITDLKNAEARLDEKEQQLAHIARVSALGEMVAGISHEINQPLATIANFSAASRMLLDHESDSPENRQNLREWTTRIGEQITRISDIIRNLRRFGRPGSELESFPLSVAVADAFMLTESRTRIAVDEIITEIPETLQNITADRTQIEQVLVNLIRNACDAMESIPRGQRRLRIAADATDHEVVVTVTDSGPGVDPGNAENLFNPFVTTKPDGMGIGLAISRSIIELHQGRLVALECAEGGKFQFSLPAQATNHGVAEARGHSSMLT